MWKLMKYSSCHNFISSRMPTYYILSYQFVSWLKLRKKGLISIIYFFASTDKQWADFSKKITYNIYQYLKNKYHVSFLKILEPRYLRPIPTNMEGARIFRKKCNYPIVCSTKYPLYYKKFWVPFSSTEQFTRKEFVIQ